MSHKSERDPFEITGRRGAGGRLYGPDCGAGELRGMLKRIADHIAHADERQQSALGDMQTRLAHLVDRWPGPSQAFAGEDRGPMPDSPRDAAPGRRPASPPKREPPQFEKRGLGEAPPLSSAAAHPGYGRWNRRTITPADTGADALSAQPRCTRPEDQGGGWDSDSAEALTRIYDPNDAADFHRVSSQPHQTDAGPVGQGIRAESRRRPEVDGYEHNRAMRPESGDRLESRFAELASRVEQALAQLTPEASAARLDERLASFEQRIGSALAGLATRADVEQLQAVEAHIEELSRHIEQAQSRLARLDEIELGLTRLVEQTSDEHVVELMERQVLSEPRLARLAEAVAAHLAERDAFRGEVGAGLDRLRELYRLIEQFVAAQRQSDQQTGSALEVIQQAVLNLLDRMEDLEHSYAPATRADSEADDEQGWEAGRSDNLTTFDPTRRPAPETDPYAVGVVSISNRTKDPSFAGNSDDSEAASGEARIASAIAKAELPGHLPPVSSESSHEEGPVPERDASEGKSLLHKSREDFLAAARRAARKASSEAGGMPARGAGHQSAPGRNRRASGARPLTGLVVAVLALVLAVGVGFTSYSLYKDGLSETWEFGRSVWELGSGGRGAAGGSAESERPPPAETPRAGPSRPASRTPSGSTIEEPGDRRAPESEGSFDGPRKLTGMPGGIVVDTGMIAATARAGQIAAPAVYTPQDGGDLSEQSRTTGQEERPMPPVAVGPQPLRAAAASGDPSAEFAVALRLDEGRGVARDLEQAVVWYRRSAARGFAPAQYRLGTLYERGLGVDADHGRAMAWYRSAAEKGNVKAMHNFAVLSASGNPADFEAAAHWFGKAAERGLVDSQFNLAVLYETGRGVEQDLKQAYIWFALAARGGDDEAARRRDRVKWMLDAGELEAAKALVRAWKPLPLKAEVNSVRAAEEMWKRPDRQG